MGRTDPGPQKYKESSKIDGIFFQERYLTELVQRTKRREIVTRYNTTPGDKFAARYPPDPCQKFAKSKSEHDCSVAHYEYYLKHNLYIKSAVEKQNIVNFQGKKVSFRNYTPKILSQEVNMGMWI